MRILICPDKFKGSLSALEAAAAIARGFRAALPGAELILSPIADGGEGFAGTLCEALQGSWVETESRDALGRPVAGRYAWVDSVKLAVIDMSEAAGLWRLRAEERDPLRANTFGVGQMMRHAAGAGARKILVGLGGSATTDGGAGMAVALGFDFYTSDGEPLPPEPGKLLALTRIGSRDAVALPEIEAACDVQNPLLGPRGAAPVFGPQKGADERTVKHLELALENLADVCRLEFERDFRDFPGAGAAGGLGFGLLTFCRATVRSGFEVVAEASGLDEKVRSSDLIVTGEGRLDAQTLEGKGPAGVARLARRYGKPVVAFGGSVQGQEALAVAFDLTCAIVDATIPLEEAMSRGAEFLEGAAFRLGPTLTPEARTR